eukprot:9172473-Karenia_brevis.AAC.1
MKKKSQYADSPNSPNFLLAPGLLWQADLFPLAEMQADDPLALVDGNDDSGEEVDTGGLPEELVEELLWMPE